MTENNIRESTKIVEMFQQFSNFFLSIMYLLFGCITPGGWSGGAMVLGKLPVPGRPTIG